MQNLTTIARPYAKAILALATERQDYATWSRMLKFLTDVMNDPAAAGYLRNIAVPTTEKAEFICNLAPDQLTAEGQNLVRVLAHAKRLQIIPALYKLYEKLRRAAQHEVLMHLQVARSTPDAMLQDLKDRISGNVDLSVVQDKDLLGGGLVRIDDRVVDGSLYGRLHALQEFIRN